MCFSLAPKGSEGSRKREVDVYYSTYYLVDFFDFFFPLLPMPQLKALANKFFAVWNGLCLFVFVLN